MCNLHIAYNFMLVWHLAECDLDKCPLQLMILTGCPLTQYHLCNRCLFAINNYRFTQNCCLLVSYCARQFPQLIKGLWSPFAVYLMLAFLEATFTSRI